jgi:hypothetical protein
LKTSMVTFMVTSVATSMAASGIGLVLLCFLVVVALPDDQYLVLFEAFL